MPLRGDFDVEYDNDAELLLAEMEFNGMVFNSNLIIEYWFKWIYYNFYWVFIAFYNYFLNYLDDDT